MILDKTCQVYLPNGNPLGVRLWDWETLGVVGLAEIPRNHLMDFLALPQAHQSGVYVLLGGQEMYIGQTTDLKTRLQKHHKDKAFWQMALVFFSLKDNFELNELIYLEKLAIQTVQKIGRYTLTNGTEGNNAFTSNRTEQKCRHIFAEMTFLLNVAKCDCFTENAFRQPENALFTQSSKAMTPDLTENSTQMLFYCHRLHTDACGYKSPNSDEFILLAGSLFRKKISSGLGKSRQVKRQQWIEKQILVEHNEHSLRLTQDMVMKSPSFAAAMVVACNTNGWHTWKNEKGETLDEIYRQK